MKKLVAVLVVAAGLPASSAALAENWYLGAAIGQSKSNETCGEVSVPCDDNDTAWRIFGGYQFNRHLGAELGYADLGTPASASGTISGVSLTVRTEVKAWDLVAVASYPIDRFSVYGKAGLYRAETDTTATSLTTGLTITTSDTNTDLTFGLGAGFNFTRNLSVRTEWQRYKDVGGGDVGEDHVDVLSAGLIWRF